MTDRNDLKAKVLIQQSREMLENAGKYRCYGNHTRHETDLGVVYVSWFNGVPFLEDKPLTEPPPDDPEFNSTPDYEFYQRKYEGQIPWDPREWPPN